MSTYDGAAPPDGGSADVSENVAEDLVRYVRSNTIRNEEQFLLTAFGYVSGYMADPHRYLSGVLIGTASSGKSHLQNRIERLFPEAHLYQATTGTDKSFIYDGTWEDAWIASLDELQKVSETITEFLKGVHGSEDGQFVYKLTPDSAEQREAEVIEEIVRTAKPYWFLYAQYEPDFELWNRLLKVPVHESESKNRAVGAMAFDHDRITVGDGNVEYRYDYHRGLQAIQRHVRDLADGAPYDVVLPNGGDGHEWDVWSIVEPIFNHSRSEVNRIYNMVANLIRCSAVWNHHQREEIDDGESGVTTLVAEPQDVANVLRCREVLLATTHEIDRKKRAICTAIDVKSGSTNEIEGVAPILEHLTETDAPSVKKSELDNILEDLQDNYLIEIHHGAGEGGDDVYEFLGWDELGFARVAEYGDLFEGTTDPVGGGTFLDTHDEMRDELETTASDLLGAATGESRSSRRSRSGGSSGDDPNTGLSSFGAGTSDDEVDLDPLENLVAEYCVSLLDGERIEDLRDVPVEAFLGLVPLHDLDRDRKDTTDSPLDPDHDVWDQSDKPDDWVSTEQEARREIKRTVRDLIDKNVIRFDTVHESIDGEPVDATIRVAVPGNTG